MNALITRSVELEERLLEFLNREPLKNSTRRSTSRILLSVSFEHAESLKLLIASGNSTSGIGMLRLQFEALVRSMWICYAASEERVSTLSSELTSESARKATNQHPGLSEMLTKLDGKAPKEAMDLLLEFKEYHWKPLSSFVHGGIHAIIRHGTGYPPTLLAPLVKGSNGVSMMSAMMLVILSGDPAQQGKLPAIQTEFADCLPPAKG